MNTCRTCRTPIDWAETVPAGKRIPLDKEPADPWTTGALILLGRFAYGPQDLASRMSAKKGISELTAKTELDDADWRTSHFATCAQADQHRRPR